MNKNPRRPLTQEQRKIAADIVVASDKRTGRETPAWITEIHEGKVPSSAPLEKTSNQGDAE